jgi:isocitrate/isopropylmalate dehydrogenase
MSGPAPRPRRYRVGVIPGDGVGPEVIAHPIGAVWSAGMLLDDLGGRATTDEVGVALVQAIEPPTGA